MGTDGLVAALARAQAAFGPIAKAHENPHFKSKYADLADVLAVVRPCLNAEGIALTQPIQTDDDGRVRLYTILEGHGETRTASLPLYLDNMTPQQLLSTLTYYRRGLLAALLGVAAEDDDDGNAAQTASQPRFEPEEADIAQSREALQEAISGLSDGEKELVRLELRNQRVPSLKKPGATRQQLDSLTDFLAGLKARVEPFDTGYDFTSDDPSASHYKPDAHPPKPDPADIPFNPTVYADESGTVRKARNSAARADV